MTLTLSGTDGMTAPQGAVYNGLQYATAQTPTTANADFTSVPSWARRVTIVFSEVSTNSSNAVTVRLSTGGAFVTSGYISVGWVGGSGNVSETSTTAFVVDGGSQTSSSSRCGSVTLVNITGNTWVISGTVSTTASVVSAVGGRVTLGGTLDGVRVLSNGTFDAGTINVFWE
jgi:hypothetical protein